jgi:hypothetical protein
MRVNLDDEPGQELAPNQFAHWCGGLMTTIGKTTNPR